MFSTLRTRFGIPGVISVIALVFALIGGAWAANNSSSGGKATASAKAKRGPRGPKGATGPAGPTGPTGPAGPAGAKGDNGSNGSAGSAGAPGADGQSVTTEEIFAFEECGEQEGVRLTSASGENVVCNGTNGTNGTNGAEGPAGPSCASNVCTGTWIAAGEGEATASISFLSRLASAPEMVYVSGGLGFIIDPGTGKPEPGFLEGASAIEPHCGSGSVSNPQAKPGNLCVYQGELHEVPSEAGIPYPLFEMVFAEVANPRWASSDPRSGVNFSLTGSSESAYGKGSWALNLE